jgi:hypothetical protein
MLGARRRSRDVSRPEAHPPQGSAQVSPLVSLPMSDPPQEPEPPYHLFLDPVEVPVAAGALRLLISDEAHEPDIRSLARDVLTGLEQPADEQGMLTLTLTPQQMKITHSAVKLLLNDLQREQAEEREVLKSILDKLPDEHTMRAIQID